MQGCFYCADKNHVTADCRFIKEDVSAKTKARRIKKWGYMSGAELINDLTQQAFAPRRLPWLAYFFRYSNIEEMLNAEALSGLLAGSKSECSDSERLEAGNLLKMGREKFIEGIYQQSLVILALALEKKPKDCRILITKGYAHIMRSEPDQALACFNSAAEASVSAYYRNLARLLIARVYQYTGETDRAIIYSQKAISTKLAEASYLLAILYVEKELIEDGLAQLQLAIEENREYLVAACYEIAFSRIEPELNFFLDNFIQAEEKMASQQLDKLQLRINEVKNMQAEMYDPMDFKNARFKYFMARKKYETESYFGYVDAKRLVSESITYLQTAKISTVGRKKLAVNTLKENLKLSYRCGILYGVCAAGWGLVVGGGFGLAVALKFGLHNQHKIFTYALKGAILGFLTVYIYNWRITNYKRKFFLKNFAKRFNRQRGKLQDSKQNK
jgi:tetratricopeptide (TPR) repeat protein